MWGSHSLIQGGKKLCPKICGEVGKGKSTTGEVVDTPPRVPGSIIKMVHSRSSRNDLYKSL